jgi:hypothetical protein
LCSKSSCSNFVWTSLSEDNTCESDELSDSLLADFGTNFFEVIGVKKVGDEVKSSRRPLAGAVVTRRRGVVSLLDLLIKLRLAEFCWTEI